MTFDDLEKGAYFIFRKSIVKTKLVKDEREVTFVSLCRKIEGKINGRFAYIGLDIPGGNVFEIDDTLAEWEVIQIFC